MAQAGEFGVNKSKIPIEPNANMLELSSRLLKLGTGLLELGNSLAEKTFSKTDNPALAAKAKIKLKGQNKEQTEKNDRTMKGRPIKKAGPSCRKIRDNKRQKIKT
jgi:hypothetical protein